MMLKKFGFLLALCLVPGTAQAADKWEYRACDGYGAPSGSGDGIISTSSMLGLVSSVTDLRKADNLRLGSGGLAACERVLVDRRLKSKFSIRRAHLMQASALHMIALKQYDEALSRLDEIDVLAVEEEFDPEYYRMGLGVGNRALRAFVYGETKREEEARAEIAEIRKIRAYSPRMQLMADRLELRLESSFDTQLVQWQHRGPIDPGAAIIAYFYAMELGRMEDALALGPGLSPDLPRSRGGWSISGGFDQYDLIDFRAELSGSYAYVLAATGQADQAKLQFKHARDELEETMTPPPDPDPGKSWKRDVQRDFEQRTTHGLRSLGRIELWEDLVELRLSLPNLTSEQFTEKLLGFDAAGVPVIIDLFANANLGDGGELTKASLIARVRATIEERRRKELENDLEAIADLLPRPESDRNKVRFSRSGDGIFLTDSGYSRRKMDSDDDWTVRATDHAASGPSLEEAVVLAAANLAEREGYDSFLIQSRRSIQRQTRYVGYYGGGSTQNSGREAQMRIRLVNAAELPQELVGTDWRMLNTAQVIADLDARYTR
jgi:hypothetical protein